ncbi:MAG: calcium-binding protein [Solirubrobacteraceae bacterium]
MSSKWKCSIPVAGAAAAAALAFPGIASAAVNANVAAGVLTVTGEGADAITISCDAGGHVAVANAALPATDCSAITAIDVTGGDGAGVITLTGVTAAAYPALTQTTIDGGAGNDQIFGSEKVDDMHGGAGDDQIIGDDNPAGTRDVFAGEAGDDLLIWRGGEDDDTMDGGDGADTVQVQGAGAPEAFTVKPSTTAGRVIFDRLATPGPGPFNLDIGTTETLDLNAGGGDDTLATEVGTGPGFKLDVSGGDGNDVLDAGDAADLILGDAGNDAITPDDNPAGTRDIAQGGDGDDILTWNGGDDDDVNDGGAGNDTVVVNGAGAPEAFTLNASATPGHATFDRAATPGPGPFNIDIVTSEVLDLRANGGDDTFGSDGEIAALGLRANVTGGDGNDVLDGTNAADLLDGGAGDDRITPDDNPAGTRDDARGGDGNDTIVWNGGDDDDTNEGGAGDDVSLINGATADERFTIKPSATDGRVLFDRLATPGPGPFNVDIGTTETLQLEANAGNDRVKGAKGVAGRISTVINAGDGNDIVKGTDAEDAISLGKGSDIAKTIDKAEDTVSCDQGIDLALVDRRDFLRQCELVIGGLPRVAIKGKPQLEGDSAAVRLKCVATQKCRSVVKLKAGGKTLGRGKATMKRNKTKTVDVELNRRGLRSLSAGDRVKVQVVSKDNRGNGWRSQKTVRVA